MIHMIVALRNLANALKNVVCSCLNFGGLRSSVRFRLSFHLIRERTDGWACSGMYQKPTFITLYNVKYWRGSYIVIQSDVEMNRRLWTDHFTVHLCIKLGVLRYTWRGGGDRGSTVVKALCYKSEGRWFDPSWCQWIFH